MIEAEPSFNKFLPELDVDCLPIYENTYEESHELQTDHADQNALELLEVGQLIVYESLFEDLESQTQDL